MIPSNFSVDGNVWADTLLWYSCRPGEEQDIPPKEVTIENQLLHVKKINGKKAILFGDHTLTPKEIHQITEMILPKIKDLEPIEKVRTSMISLKDKWNPQNKMDLAALDTSGTTFDRMTRQYALWANYNKKWKHIALSILSFGILWAIKVLGDRSLQHVGNSFKLETLQNDQTSQRKQVAQILVKAKKAAFKEVGEIVNAIGSDAQPSQPRAPLPELPTVTKDQLKSVRIHPNFYSMTSAVTKIPKAVGDTGVPEDIDLNEIVRWSKEVQPLLNEMSKFGMVDNDGWKTSVSSIISVVENVITSITTGKGLSKLSSDESEKFINRLRHIVLYFQKKEADLEEQKGTLSSKQYEEALKRLQLEKNEVIHLRLGIGLLHCSDRWMTVTENIYFDTIAPNPQTLQQLYGIRDVILRKLFMDRLEVFKQSVATVSGKDDPHQVSTVRYYRCKLREKYGLGEEDKEPSKWSACALNSGADSEKAFIKRIEQEFEKNYPATHILDTLHRLFIESKINEQLFNFWLRGTFKVSDQDSDTNKILYADIDDANDPLFYKWRPEAAYMFLTKENILTSGEGGSRTPRTPPSRTSSTSQISQGDYLTDEQLARYLAEADAVDV